jgi:hypothetical protein
MKVERSLFHVLVGALATGAVACVVKEYQPPPPPPPAPPPPVANNTPPPPPGQQGHLGVLHAQNTKGQPAPAPAPGPMHFGPLRPVGPTPSPSPAPSSCLDSGNAPAPALCNPQLNCPSNPFPKQRCATYASDFDPKVAASAIICMNNLSGAAQCDSQHAYDCGKAALAQACPDSTVSQLCQIAAGPCKVSQNDCVNMVSGLNSTGQDAVAQCIAGGCNGGNLYSCIEGLH